MEYKFVLTGPKLTHSVPNISLGQHLYQCLSSHGEKVAQVDAVTGETRKYSEIFSKSLNIAGFLCSRGLKSGDVVGICSENNLDFILPVVAAYLIGATCAPLNPKYTIYELQHAASISKPRIIFCSEHALENIDKLSREAGFIKDIVVFGRPMSHKQFAFRNILWNKSSNFLPLEVDHKNLVAVILCSSGTTGLPKGVMLTHANILHAVEYVCDYRYSDMRPSDTVLAVLPMFHAYMFLCQLIGCIIGVKFVIMGRFEEDVFLRSIQNHKITLLYLVPPIIVLLAKSSAVDKYDLSSVRDIISGAAPLKHDIEVLVCERLGLGQIRQGYGLTEATLALTMIPSNTKKRGSSGVLIPDTECKVVDVQSGQSLGPHKEGELCFRGPGIMKGYSGNLQATSAMIDSDGFLHTGDVGYYDEEGFFFIVDRVKELIKYKGFQVTYLHRKDYMEVSYLLT
ncbi:luciferin 4-monooxygenase-like isoform X2 [Periplaneta americana]|uniref:luciferin 4-monooxygenase-like isoform X2 n=1 Tax=Periplaneta americana TaxID=6978 RepID=UPI0037E76F0A